MSTFFHKNLRLRTVFGVILLFILLLPLSGGYFFRIYENELVRQTESELIAQGVFISAVYKDALKQVTALPQNYGAPLATPPAPTLPDEKYKPVRPMLDLRKADILPPRQDGAANTLSPTAFETAIGQRLMPVLQDAKISTLASLRILNPHGVVIGGTNEIGLSLASAIEVQTALQGNYASVLRKRVSDEPRPPISSLSRGTDVRVFIALPIELNNRVMGVAYLSRSPRNILNAMYEEKESIFLAGFFILLLTGGIAWLLSHTLGKPLRTLNRYALQLARGERITTTLPSPPIAEVATLTQSVERMAHTLEARSDYIRSFAMHLAHEFKTPLTAIQGALELLHDHPDDMSEEQRRRFFTNIMQDTDRLKKLVSRLLELARADVMQARRESCDALALFKALEVRYAPRVQYHSAASEASLNIGADVLETVLCNLIDNSLQQNAANVLLTLTSAEGIATIDVTDNGNGISEANAQKIFTPFFTTRRENGGTGLGLIITQSLLKAHGGSITCHPQEIGVRFKVTLPVSE